MTAIKFYSARAEYGCFSNFSRHKVMLDGHTWPTSEHYFQAMKFHPHRPDLVKKVREAKSPGEAAQLGRDRSNPLRKDWESVKDSIMLKVVYAKFRQHDRLKDILLDTGDAQIIEHTDRDSYWGDGGDGSGKNRLGKILEAVRSKLRQPIILHPKTGPFAGVDVVISPSHEQEINKEIYKPYVKRILEALDVKKALLTDLSEISDFLLGQDYQDEYYEELERSLGLKIKKRELVLSIVKRMAASETNE